MTTTLSEEIPLEHHYAVFRVENGGLIVRKVRGKVKRFLISLANEKTHIQTFHIVEGYFDKFCWAEMQHNFLAAIELDPDTRRRETEPEWFQREIREALNEWII